MGTLSHPYASTFSDDGYLQSITAMLAYRGFSVEELRSQDYQAGRRPWRWGIDQSLLPSSQPLLPSSQPAMIKPEVKLGYNTPPKIPSSNQGTPVPSCNPSPKPEPSEYEEGQSIVGLPSSQLVMIKPGLKRGENTPLKKILSSNQGTPGPPCNPSSYEEGQSFVGQIEGLPKHDIDIPALLRIASEKLSQTSMPDIRLWKEDGFCKLYLLTFEDTATEVIARISSVAAREDNCLDRIRSEVDTMTFVRQYYQGHIPVPNIITWDDATPIGAPFILMEKPPGDFLDDSAWEALTLAERLPIMKSLTAIHAKLAGPVPFLKIGNIVDIGDKVLNFEIGEVPSRRLVDPALPVRALSADLKELWFSMTENEFLAGHSRWSHQEEDTVIFNKLGNQKTISDFAGLYADLTAIVSGFHITNPEFDSLCLLHRGLGLRNVIFDKTWRITGVIGWNEASVVPLVLAGHFPDEISAADSTPERQVDVEKVDSTWCRWFYRAQMTKKDPRFSKEFWKESALAMELDDLICGGWQKWMEKEGRIKVLLKLVSS